MKVTTKATVNNGGLCKKIGNQTIEFCSCGKGGVSMFFIDGEIKNPEMEITFQPNEVEKILKFLTDKN